MPISNKPTYNLKAVIKKTGIAADTLRAWERRYGLPMPERTSGGHRKYSQRDIEIIKWLMTKQREGLSISRAVDMWNDLIDSGQDPLPSPGRESDGARRLASASGATPVTQNISAPSANLDAVRKQWLDACLTFNDNVAGQVLNQAFALYPLESVCFEVLQTALFEIGELWYRAKATVQQEHFTSALAHRRLDSLIAAAAHPNRSETILIGCPPKEQHTFSSLLLTLLLRRRGLNVIYLGANVPFEHFAKTAQTVKPHLVILSAQLLQTASGLKDVADHLTGSGESVAYGGRIFNLSPELRNHIPAHFLGETIQVAENTVESLLDKERRPSGYLPVHTQDVELNKLFLRSQPLIDMYALTMMNPIGIPETFSALAIQQLGNNLSAALALGSIESMSLELGWIKAFLQENYQSSENLENFITAYAKAIISAMGTVGQPISEWLISQVARK